MTMFDKRSAGVCAALALTAIGQTAFAAPSESKKRQKDGRPNIVYIMTDDHTGQAMGCYGGPQNAQKVNPTPNLDRIANEGVRFTNSYVANSLSGPSRACMITGKYSSSSKPRCLAIAA